MTLSGDSSMDKILDVKHPDFGYSDNLKKLTELELIESYKQIRLNGGYISPCLLRLVSNLDILGI